MTILSYFDSSDLLAIVQDESKKIEAYEYWHNAKIRCSSILLKIETIVSLRRTYEHNKAKLPQDWLEEKTKILQEYLNEVTYHVVNEKIEREILMRKELSYCRALDAIHIATALRFREMENADAVYIYTFDDRMKTLAELFHFKVNQNIQ
jgi:predicted nucleic acid-binding protein